MPEAAQTIRLLLTAAALAACTATTPTDLESPTSLGAATTPPITPTTAASGSADGPPEIAVPKAPAAPVIDGVLDPDEWTQAATFTMSDGAQLRAMYHGQSLYLAVGGEEIGAVNVVLGTDEEIQILHSSAALGSALYQPGEGQWQLTHGFSWCCRDRNLDTERQSLLDEEGWQANIGFAGDPGVVEYQIDFPWQGSAMVVSSIRSEGDFGVWPASLSTEAQLQLFGAPPDTRSYDTATWPVLTGATHS